MPVWIYGSNNIGVHGKGLSSKLGLDCQTLHVR
jgi:hypothetical protein